MFHIVLYEPEIPPNTGNIIRLCANTRTPLHLIHPLGFHFDDRRLRRAGLDYSEFAQVKHHQSVNEFKTSVEPTRLFAVSTKAATDYHLTSYQPGDALLFGPETRGLPETLIKSFEPEQTLRIPMAPNSRSLNLANAVAVILFEAWRQNAFCFSKGDPT